MNSKNPLQPISLLPTNNADDPKQMAALYSPVDILGLLENSTIRVSISSRLPVTTSFFHTDTEGKITFHFYLNYDQAVKEVLRMALGFFFGWRGFQEVKKIIYQQVIKHFKLKEGEKKTISYWHMGSEHITFRNEVKARHFRTALYGEIKRVEGQTIYNYLYGKEKKDDIKI